MWGGAEVGVNIQGLPAYEIYNEKFQILLPSGEPMKFIDYKVSTSDQEFIAQADNKGKSKRINTEGEEGLILDLNWMTLEIDESEGEVE